MLATERVCTWGEGQNMNTEKREEGETKTVRRSAN
jgi:hypothetical protein